MARTRLAYAEEFQTYLDHPMIATVADQPRWTVSDDDKVPIDMRELLYDNPRDIHGARRPDDSCLVTRDLLVEAYANVEYGAPNHAFYADITQDDPFIILDVEASCPPALAKQFLDTLPWVYAERSLSGKGHHLVLPTPWDTSHGPGFLHALLPDDERHEVADELWYALIERRVLRDAKGQFEFLLRHYATFTFLSDGYPPPPPLDATRASNALRALRMLIAASPPPSRITQYIAPDGRPKDLVVESTKPEYLYHDELVATLSRAYGYSPYLRTLADFHHDTSRWEYGVINHVLRLARSAIRDSLGLDSIHVDRPPIDENTLVWVVHDVVTTILPPREKHSTYRSGLPYLVFQIKSAFVSHAESFDPRIFATDPSRDPSIDDEDDESLDDE